MPLPAPSSPSPPLRRLAPVAAPLSPAASGRAAGTLLLAIWAVAAAVAVVVAVSDGGLSGAMSLVALPLGLAAAVAVGVLVMRACRGNPTALLVLAGFVIVGLSLNFRTRELGEVGLDAQNGAKLLLWGAVFAIALVRLGRIWPLLAQWPMAWLMAYSLLGMLSALWSEVPLYTFASAFGLTAYLLFGAVLAQTMPLDRLMRALTCWLGLYVAINVASVVVLPDLALAPPSAEEVSWRVRGLAGHPNVLGHQMVVALLLAVGCAARRSIAALPLALLILGAAGLLVASGSRTSLITGVLVLAIIWLRRRPSLLLAGLFAAAMVGGMLVALPADMVNGVFAGLSRSGDVSEMTTLTGRTDIWAFGLDKIAARPWLGYGYNGAEPILTRELVTEDANATVNLHNMYLQSVFCLGLLGSLPLLFVLAWLAGKFAASPSIERDLFFLCQVFTGMAEVEAFGGTPGMVTLILIVVTASRADAVP